MKPLTTVRSAFGICVLCAAGLAAVSPQAPAAGNTCTTRSAATRVTVLELYTSEGCNSCPPADRWVSSLPSRGFTPDRVVPLAFHVDYWDQLGWPDRMAKAQFSARQRLQAQRNRASVIYTPQLLLNGADYRSSFFDSQFDDRIKALNQLPSAAELLLQQRPLDHGVEVELEVRLAPSVAAGAVQTYVAITENRLQSAIKAGENQGKLLRHDFVVREFAGPLPMDPVAGLRWKSTIALPQDWKRSDISVVAFVENARNGEIQQAVRAPLCTRP